jgi:alanine dehydrogenase
MTQQTYKEELTQAENDKYSEKGAEIIDLFEQLEELIFMGSQEPQPLKWHQLKRIYKLAEYCIKIVLLLVPYVRVLIKWVK